VAPLEEQLGSYLAQRRFQTSLLTGFSLVALLRAAVGIYGLIQYSIATRTRKSACGWPSTHSPATSSHDDGEGLRLSLSGLDLGLMGAW
jgi:putative ABC transport system permease protein